MKPANSPSLLTDILARQDLSSPINEEVGEIVRCCIEQFEEILHPWELLCRVSEGLDFSMQSDVPQESLDTDIIYVKNEIVSSIGLVLLDEDRLTWSRRISWCQTPQDYRNFFKSLGIKDDQWRIGNWFLKEAPKTESEGGIGKPLWGLCMVLADDKHFGGFREFVAWMDGWENGAAYPEMVKRCQTPKDFLDLFAKLEIPGNKWKTGYYLVYVAKKSPKEGGIGKTLAGLKAAICGDGRFKNYSAFAAWMEGKIPDEPPEPWPLRLKRCETPEQILELLASVGITDDRWKNSDWLCKGARSSKDQGGIGKPMKGFYKAIRNDSRFEGDFRAFVAWMEGKDQPDPSITAKMESLLTPDDYIQYFRECGVHGDQWKSVSWMQFDSGVSKHDGGIGKSLSWPCALVIKKFKTYRLFLEFMGETEFPNCWDVVTTLETPDDFRNYFAEIGIPGDKWSDYCWMNTGASHPVSEGGIGRTLSGLRCAITRDPRFHGRWPKFIDWMGLPEKNRSWKIDWQSKVNACETPLDLLTVFRAAGITGDQWKSKSWFKHESKFPPPIGIGVNLAGLGRAVVSRFSKSHRTFLRWMGEPTLFERFCSCETPEQCVALFSDHQVPISTWDNAAEILASSDDSAGAKLLRKRITQLRSTVARDKKRFQGSLLRFNAWLHGRDSGKQEREGSPQNDLTDFEMRNSDLDLLNACIEREDFLEFFKKIGVPNDKWKVRLWMTKTAPLSTDEGGIGRPLWFLTCAICARFGTYLRFVRWMNGEELEQILVARFSEQVRQCTTPPEFLTLFSQYDIPDDAWREKKWMTETIALSPEEGGLGRPITALGFAIITDTRWGGSWRKFEAFMDGKPVEAAMFMSDRMASLKTREDFLAFFKELGIPGECWKSTNWLERTAKEPPPIGIGKSLQSVSKAIRKNYKPYRKFVAWMEGRDTFEATSNELVATLPTPADFLRYFDSQGFPQDKWRDSRWYTRGALLSVEQGGLGRSFSGLYAAIRKRFETFTAFEDWMDGLEDPTLSIAETFRKFTSPQEFLDYFDERGIPNNAWRSCLWLSKIAKLPVEQGGIGVHCSGIYSAITNDKRFTTFKHFKDWMDGVPLEGISSREQAIIFLQQEAERLELPIESLLKPEIMRPLLLKSAILRHVMVFFDRQSLSKV